MNRFDCPETCGLVKPKRTFQDLLARSDGTVGTVNGKFLRFSPVGNAPSNPVAIVCGKVPDQETQRKFFERCRRGQTPEQAAVESVFSYRPTRHSLYLGLEKIGLFRMLQDLVPYWTHDDTVSP